MTDTPAPLTAPDLEQRLRAVMPAARVVRQRYLRRVLRRSDEECAPVAGVEAAVAVGREWLRGADLVPDKVTEGTGDGIVLLTDPADLFPVDRPAGEMLRHYWRLLFQVAVTTTARKQLGSGPAAAARVAERFAAIGPAGVLEMRFVLEADHTIPVGANDLSLYTAFVARFADLHLFNPCGLCHVFPAIVDAAACYRIVAEDAPLDRLFRETRPAGADEPSAAPTTNDRAAVDPGEIAVPALELGIGTMTLEMRVAAAVRVGNRVRAAILQTRAALAAGKANDPAAIETARSAIHDGLVKRLATILGWNYQTAKAWTEALLPLFTAASDGLLPRAARGLYDLQKIVTDLTGEISIVDPVEWAVTLCRRPLVRPLTRARDVILLRHLRGAHTHFVRSSIALTDLARVEKLLHKEMAAAEERIHTGLEPVIAGALATAGFHAANRAEQIALDKLVGELLDRVCERGFIRFGDLRDAVARNQIKMADLRGPLELLGGDALLRADERLAVDLDGVYHRGEIYLRWIQRGTAVAFGTRVGRWVSKYVALPFGGAFMIVEFARYLRHEGAKIHSFLRGLLPHDAEDEALVDTIGAQLPEAGTVWGARAQPAVEAAAAVPPDTTHAAGAHGHHGVAFTPESLAITVILGFVILGLLYHPGFQAGVLGALARVGRGLRFILVTAPLAVWRLPIFCAVRNNVVTRFVYYHFGPPLLAALVAVLVLAVLGSGPRRMLRWGGCVFALAVVLFNTPVGRRLRDETTGAADDAWRTFRINLLPGLVSWVVWAFRELVGLVERGLYAIDEWFRFRKGQSSGSLALKIAVAIVWFPIAYVIRFAFYLLLEPQVNPVKHFPVVTVSHKLLLPQIGAISNATGLGVGEVGAILSGVPGIFGFIAWELKENWRLYAANRPRALTPVVLGHHGESMRGLLRPGFHSGTIPSLFKKFRAAVRRGAIEGRAVAVGKITHNLADVEHALHDLVARECLPLLRGSACWRGLTPTAGRVRTGVQTVELGIDVPELDGTGLRVAFDHSGDAIVARVTAPSWIGQLTRDQNEVLHKMIDGLRAMGAATTATEPAPDWDEWVRFWDRVRTA